MTFSPAELTTSLAKGLLSFPLTFFDGSGAFNEAGYRAHVASQGSAGAAGLFAAGGTGEFFSLTLDEYRRVVRAAADEVPAHVPLLAGVGYGTKMAVEFAKAAEANGADGLLVLPPYLIKSEQDGLRQHLATICRSVDIGVIAYNRDNAILTPETLARLAEECPNLIGLKDGVGDIELLTGLRAEMGDHLIFIGGMPTAEVHATAAAAIGMTTYSSAIYNFAPELALSFYNALHAGRSSEIDGLIRSFFLPYLAIRNRRAGYAVSIVKAGARLAGIDCGPVRLPLLDLTADEESRLMALMRSCGMPVAEMA
ncbi:5-dehydro-4-deoxyglucarate dehydratase [Kaistia dalseonensis]|uniref:Probable 5-dehydro-4-deoxyglucarate dehydratase n=1 Tax=Kaistia dalseonensis TaxID=410840 RepID=A0ABU0H469_9HYPH|nr:5-dehydro-4-deoxyglucarate dehydratase [Kaistia dalseonensis]MCX5494525.1 5-dehydro-4-deoxyglucarate dehydratase [Kaistia dalseonensis]MDQ0437104.1 5-dehydro-4-deoxyglucarate dehydratase [Kaistia dalseonensis]